MGMLIAVILLPVLFVIVLRESLSVSGKPKPSFCGMAKSPRCVVRPPSLLDTGGGTPPRCRAVERARHHRGPAHTL